MTDQDPQSSVPSLKDAAAERGGWLIDPKRGFLLPLTGIWILALDWLLFSSNVLTAGLATPIVVAVGFSWPPD